MTKPSLHQFNLNAEDRTAIDIILNLDNPSSGDRAKALVDHIKGNGKQSQTIEDLKIEKLKSEIALVNSKRKRVEALQPIEEQKLESEVAFNKVKTISLENITPVKILETKANTRLIESKTRVTDAMAEQCEKHGVLPTTANIKAIVSDVKENYFTAKDKFSGIENKPCYDKYHNLFTCTECGIIFQCEDSEKTFAQAKINLLDHWNEKHIAATDYLIRYLHDLKYTTSKTGLDAMLDVEEENPPPTFDTKYPFCLKGCGTRTDKANGICTKCLGLVN